MSSPSTAFLPELPAGARVLVIRLRSLGDALLVTPALRALKRWRPDLRLSVLLYARFASILAGNPDLEEVIELAPAGPGGPLRLAQTGARLRGRRFAACFNLHGGTLSALLTGLSRARHRIGSSRFRYRFAYTALADPRLVFGRDRPGRESRRSWQRAACARGRATPSCTRPRTSSPRSGRLSATPPWRASSSSSTAWRRSSPAGRAKG